MGYEKTTIFWMLLPEQTLITETNSVRSCRRNCHRSGWQESLVSTDTQQQHVASAALCGPRPEHVTRCCCVLGGDVSGTFLIPQRIPASSADNSPDGPGGQFLYLLARVQWGAWWSPRTLKPSKVFIYTWNIFGSISAFGLSFRTIHKSIAEHALSSAP